MRNWEMKRADTETEAEQQLEDGWEPFSVDFVIINNVIIIRYMWFKKTTQCAEPSMKEDMEELLSYAHGNDQCDTEDFLIMDRIAKRWNLER